MKYERYNSITFTLEEDEKESFEKVIDGLKTIKERFIIADMPMMADDIDKARTMLISIWQGQTLYEAKRI